MSIESKIDQDIIKREEQNWDIHGIPEININLHREYQCDCTEDLLDHIGTRKEQKEYVYEYQCTGCGNDVTKVIPRTLYDHDMT